MYTLFIIINDVQHPFQFNNTDDFGMGDLQIYIQREVLVGIKTVM